MSVTQQHLRFDLPDLTMLRVMDAADWRDVFFKHGIGGRQEWNALRVSTPLGRLAIGPSSPAAQGWLMAHSATIASAIAEHAGLPVQMETFETPIAIACHAEETFAYQFPRLVVAKGSGDWGEMRASSFGPECGAAIVSAVAASLRREWAAWGCLPESLEGGAPFMVLSNPGWPDIVPAIHARNSGHGKPVNALLRKHLTVLSPWEVRGDFHPGPLAALGYSGMVKATPPSTLSSEQQMAMLDLAVENA